jgi:hypothetical protein
VTSVRPVSASCGAGPRPARNRGAGAEQARVHGVELVTCCGVQVSPGPGLRGPPRRAPGPPGQGWGRRRTRTAGTERMGGRTWWARRTARLGVAGMTRMVVPRTQPRCAAPGMPRPATQTRTTRTSGRRCRSESVRRVHTHCTLRAPARAGAVWTLTPYGPVRRGGCSSAGMTPGPGPYTLPSHLPPPRLRRDSETGILGSECPRPANPTRTEQGPDLGRMTRSDSE